MSVEAEDSFRVEHQPGRDLRIHDPALGYDYTFEARGPYAVFYDLAVSPAFLRTLDIAQLSKNPQAETVPGISAYSRYQHNVGIMETARAVGDGLSLDPDEVIQYALAAGLTDVPQGVKSHATDMMMEGPGGTESFHERRLGQIMVEGGLEEILARHGIAVPIDESGKITTPVPSWVEHHGARRSLDQVNYIAGEARLWYPGNDLVKEATSLHALTVSDGGEFVFNEIEQARVWGKLGLLLSSEHWQDPVNRLIMAITVETIKRTIFKRYLDGVDEVDNGEMARPEDYTFFCDEDFDRVFEAVATQQRKPDSFMTAAHQLLTILGDTERRRFRQHKAQIYMDFLKDEKATEYPSKLVNPRQFSFGPAPIFMEVTPLEGDLLEQYRGLEQRAQIVTHDGHPIATLKALKERQFDPLVMTSHGPELLSDVDRNYAVLLEQHLRAIGSVGAVRLVMNTEIEAEFVEGVNENERYMKESDGGTDGLSPDQLRRVITHAGQRARDLAIEQGKWEEV